MIIFILYMYLYRAIGMKRKMGGPSHTSKSFHANLKSKYGKYEK